MSGGGKGSQEYTVGYWYGLGAHLALCHGPLDAITEIRVGERVAWSGNVTGNTTITIDNPNLFGGEEREGPLPLLFEPGTRFGYSGEGMFYLQRVVERITGQPLDVLARQALFEPIGLKRSGFAWTPDMAQPLLTASGFQTFPAKLSSAVSPSLAQPSRRQTERRLASVATTLAKRMKSVMPIAPIISRRH